MKRRSAIAQNPAMFSSRRTVYETPQPLFDRLNEIFSFELDAAANRRNAKCEMFLSWPDGLKRTWSELTNWPIWLNPPYGKKLVSWIRKAHDEWERYGATVVVLIPSRTDTIFYHELIRRARYRLFFRGRLRFGGRMTGHSGTAPFPSLLAVFTDQRWSMSQLADLGEIVTRRNGRKARS